MLRKVLSTVVGFLVLANIGLFVIAPSPVDAGLAQNYGTCGCTGGSDPEEPQGPYEEVCVQWLYDECLDEVDCFCDSEGRPGID